MTDRPGPNRRELEGKLIAVVVQQWLLLTTAWPDARRSLRKAARVIGVRVVPLIEARGEAGRLERVLAGMAAGLAAVARVTPRNRHPAAFQLLADPELLDWSP